jgi:hypothetical protein
MHKRQDKRENEGREIKKQKKDRKDDLSPRPKPRGQNSPCRDRAQDKKAYYYRSSRSRSRKADREQPTATDRRATWKEDFTTLDVLKQSTSTDESRMPKRDGKLGTEGEEEKGQPKKPREGGGYSPRA